MANEQAAGTKPSGLLFALAVYLTDLTLVLVSDVNL